MKPRQQFGRRKRPLHDEDSDADARAMPPPLPRSRQPPADVLESEAASSSLPEVPQWHDHLRGKNVPSSVAQDSWRPELGDAITYSGNLSAAFAQRQRNHRLLRTVREASPESISQVMEPPVRSALAPRRINDLRGARHDSPSSPSPAPSLLREGRRHLSLPQSPASQRVGAEDVFENAALSHHSGSPIQTPLRQPRDFVEDDPRRGGDFSVRGLDSGRLAERHRSEGLYMEGMHRQSDSAARWSGMEESQRLTSGQGGFMEEFLGELQGDYAEASFSQPQPRIPSSLKSSMPSSPPLDETENDEFLEEASEATIDAKLPGTYLYDKALQDGCVAVAVLAEAHATKLHLIHKDAADWRPICRDVLWSMPRILLVALITGNVARATVLDPTLRSLFGGDDGFPGWMQEAEGEAPMVYSIILERNKTGSSPTPNELLGAIGLLRRYVSLQPQYDALVEDIDGARSPKAATRSRSGVNKHQFLTKLVDGRRKWIQGRIAVVLEFCDAVQKRLEEISPEKRDRPLKRAMQYIGYTFAYRQRQMDHQKGSTAFLMQLTYSVFEVMQPGDFRISAYPLCYLASPKEAKIGETLLMLLGDSFTSTGGGFNYRPPGQNNGSVDTKNWPTERVEKFWQERVKFREETGFWDDNRRTDMPLLLMQQELPVRRSSGPPGNSQQEELRAVRAKADATRRALEARKQQHVDKMRALLKEMEGQEDMSVGVDDDDREANESMQEALRKIREMLPPE